MREGEKREVKENRRKCVMIQLILVFLNVTLSKSGGAKHGRRKAHRELKSKRDEKGQLLEGRENWRKWKMEEGERKRWLKVG